MEEKDKNIQLDDPIDEEIIELNDEVPDVPDDEEIIELADFTDTPQTENEDIFKMPIEKEPPPKKKAPPPGNLPIA